jgi:hypothetical protein
MSEVDAFSRTVGVIGGGRVGQPLVILGPDLTR